MVLNTNFVCRGEEVIDIASTILEQGFGHFRNRLNINVHKKPCKMGISRNKGVSVLVGLNGTNSTHLDFFSALPSQL
jgi:hypothetical protein